MIKVLIIESSFAVRELLKDILNSDPEIVVIKMVENAKKVLDCLKQNAPDIIIMGIDVPDKTALDTAGKLMEIHPVPIIILSTELNHQEVEELYNTTNFGAVAILAKPLANDDLKYNNKVLNLIQTIKAISQVKMIRRFLKPKQVDKFTREKENLSSLNFIKCVAIGASTGGPSVLQKILSSLPKDFPAPVLVVQHISKGFLQSMIEWLSRSITLSVHIARDGEEPKSGNVYFAPDGFQMGIDKDGRIILEKGRDKNIMCPSVGHLFYSVTKVFGSDSIGILLTGMGKDGASELKLLKDHGAVTIVQDKESSVIYGMPGQAVKLGAATHILSPDEIAAFLKKLVSAK